MTGIRGAENTCSLADFLFPVSADGELKSAVKCNAILIDPVNVLIID